MALWCELLIDPGKNANFSDFNIIPLVEKSQNRVRNVKLTSLESEKKLSKKSPPAGFEPGTSGSKIPLNYLPEKTEKLDLLIFGIHYRGH